jgi:hypothetical protein
MTRSGRAKPWYDNNVVSQSRNPTQSCSQKVAG